MARLANVRARDDHLSVRSTAVSDVNGKVAKAVMTSSGCGCQIGDEPVLCDDPRVAHLDRPIPCDCRVAAKAAILALADNVTDEMMIAFCEVYTPTEQFASIDEVKAKLRNAMGAALRAVTDKGETK